MATSPRMNHPSRTAAVRWALALVSMSAPLLLAGCTATDGAAPTPTSSAVPSASPAPTATPTASPSPSPTAEAAPVLEELHQLYLSAGLPCDWAVQDPQSGPAGVSELGYCLDGETSIATYPSQAEVDALLQLNLDSIEPGLFLVGDRWAVGSQYPEDLIAAQSTMGGELWPPDSPFFE